MIRRTPDGFKVVSEEGKNLGGPYPSRKQAEERLRQVEYFKHRDSQKPRRKGMLSRKGST